MAAASFRFIENDESTLMLDVGAGVFILLFC